MNTIDSKKYTFIDLFRGTEGGGEALNGIEIPLIQRDYAQGRDMPKVNYIRTRFVGALREALIMISLSRSISSMAKLTITVRSFRSTDSSG